MRALFIVAVWGVLGCLAPVRETPLGDVDAGVDGGVDAGPALAPNVVVLFDSSGSMDAPINPSSPACPVDCGPSNRCPAGCDTRLSISREAFATWLSSHGSEARLGLVTFPGDSSCGAPGSVAVQLPPPRPFDDAAELSSKALALRQILDGVLPRGGTPTAAALRFLSTMPGLSDPIDHRDDVVLLVTDGLPNCNEANPNNMCAGPNTACRCTLSSCDTLCGIGCLDQQATIDAIIALRAKGTRTVVVGLGADALNGDAPSVLSAMAEAGGLARECPGGTDAECGEGNSCVPVSRHCLVSYYRAGTALELEAALNAVSARLKP